MVTTLFSKYTSIIRALDKPGIDDRLLLGRSGSLSAYYAPFDAATPKAKIVLVGITPGKTQMINALGEAARMLRNGESDHDALFAGKRTGAFSGAMRSNLVAVLDRVGLNDFLKIGSCATLFGSSSHLMMTTSILPFPVFVDGGNYNGKPDPWETPFLREQIETHFIPLIREMKNAVFVPLGPVPAKVLNTLLNAGTIPRGRVIAGLPHPSGANAERIKYFLGLKDRAKLSKKVDPTKLDNALNVACQSIRELAVLA